MPLRAPALDVPHPSTNITNVHALSIDTYAIADTNSDTFADMLIIVKAEDLGNLGSGGSLWVYASKNNSQVVIGSDSITWVSTTTDTDADGVRNSCDDCPTTAATPPDADGCP